ncbi:MAG: serine hydrolase [Planctomycetota bacterium]
MFQQLVAVSCLSIATGIASAQPALEDHQLRELVAEQIEPLIDSQMIPGCAVGIWRDGETHFFGLGGTNADGSGAAPNEHTLYEIGSITKVFTALLLAEMAQAGEVAFETPVADLFPDGRTVPRFGREPIRLWHLATHSSGLPGMPSNMVPADAGDPFEGYTTELMYDFLDAVQPFRTPGQGYEYSNLATGLLGRLLEARAGAPWHELLDTRIFGPVGMTESMVMVDAEIERRLAHPSAEGLTASRWGGMDALAPCGAIVSSAADLMKFAIWNIEPGQPGSRLARALEAAHEPRFTDPETGQVVALGWHLAGDGVTLWHNGMTGGYSAMLLINKPERTAVVLLANGATFATTAAGNAIMHALLTGNSEPPPSEPAREIAADHLERLVGDYTSPLGFTIHVTREGGRLGARLTGQTRLRVFPEGDGDAPSRFRYRVVPAVLAFELPQEGKATAVTLEQGGREMRAERSE